MATKLEAARIVVERGIPMVILNGKDPAVLYELLDGKHVGTYFAAN
jgi:glutamate 5-kinase